MRQTDETGASVDAAEVARFEALAREWWDPKGKFAPLHAMNPCRLGYVVEQVTAEHGRDPKDRHSLRGLRVLDIGCGGGLLAEPMARLGAGVVGADAGETAIEVARLHAERAGLHVDYRATTAEALADAGEGFDVVLCMEVVEHVNDPRAFLSAVARLLRPGGILIASTLNRTAKSWLMAVVGAERVLGWLPRGTHEWSRFLTPDELMGMLRDSGLTPVDARGFVFDPLTWIWRVSARDLDVNYAVAAVRP